MESRNVPLINKFCKNYVEKSRIYQTAKIHISEILKNCCLWNYYPLCPCDLESPGFCVELISYLFCDIEIFQKSLRKYLEISYYLCGNFLVICPKRTPQIVLVLLAPSNTRIDSKTVCCALIGWNFFYCSSWQHH